jgi:aryl-alcohol dehydrogenase-like predicted oxidoreductase
VTFLDRGDVEGAVTRSTLVLGGDLPVHRLGFGAMRITGSGIWGEPPDRAEAGAVLRRAVELGVNLIDTADSYGPDVSERIIGETFPTLPRGLVVATKGGLVRPGPDRWDPDGRPTHLREALEGSLRRLHLRRIDLYQFHRPDPKVPFAESLGTLREFAREGKIRHVGLCNVTVDQLEEARSIVPIVSVQNRYNVGDRASEPVLERCEELGLGFIPWFPLASGRLTQEKGSLAHVAKRLRATPSQVALAWLLQKSPVMLPIPGTSRVSHLEENLRAAALALGPRDIEELDELGSHSVPAA